VVELSRWAPVAVIFVWFIFFGHAKKTRRLYGPTVRRAWEFTTGTFATEPLTFGSVAAKPHEISDFSTSFSLIDDSRSTMRGDDGTNAPTTLSIPILPWQLENGEGTGSRSRSSWGSWFKAAAANS